MSEEPLVSVIIPVYNRLIYLHQAIESVLNQSYPHLEIIIVDDGSTVDVKEFIDRQFSSPKIKSFKKEHSGLSQTLNFGIKRAQGSYLAFLDDDDIWHPEMIQTCVQQLLSQKGDMAVVGFSYFKESPNPNGNSFRGIKNIKGILNTMTWKNIIPVNTVVIKKNLVERVDGFNPVMSACMDWDLWLRILAQDVKLTVINKNLSFIRVHQNNMSRNEIFMKKGCLQVLENAKVYMPQDMQKSVQLGRKIALRKFILRFYLEAENNKILEVMLNLVKFIFRLKNIYES